MERFDSVWNLEKRRHMGVGNNYIIARFMIYTLQYLLLYTERKDYERGNDRNRECVQNFGRKV